MSKPIAFNQFAKGLSPEAEAVALALWAANCITPDVAFSLAQHAASSSASKLTAEQLLLCILSDFMAMQFHKDRKACFEFLTAE